MPIRERRPTQVAPVTEYDPHVVVHVGVLWFANKRLLVRVQRSVILTRCVQSQTEVTIGLCVTWVHAKCRPSFGDGVVSVVGTIEEISQAVVGLWKAGQQAGGFGKFIKRPVP